MKKIIICCFIAILLLHGVAFGAFNFIDNGDGTVTDARTGLFWLKNVNPGGLMTFDEAVAYCSTLASGIAGLTDGSIAGQWRLPTKEELEGIGTEPPVTWESGDCPVSWTMPAGVHPVPPALVATPRQVAPTRFVVDSTTSVTSAAFVLR